MLMNTNRILNIITERIQESCRGIISTESACVHVSAYNAYWKKKSANDRLMIPILSAWHIPCDHCIHRVLFVHLPHGRLLSFSFEAAGVASRDNFIIIVSSRRRLEIISRRKQANEMGRWPCTFQRISVEVGRAKGTLDDFSKKIEMRLLCKGR